MKILTLVLAVFLVGVLTSHLDANGAAAQPRKGAGKAKPAKNLPPLVNDPASPGYLFQLQPGQPGFTQLVETAEVITNIDDAVWALIHSCTAGDALEQRQCRAVREARVKAWTGKTLLVTPDAGSFVFSSWDPKAKSVTWKLNACIRCTGVVVDGTKYEVVAAPLGSTGVQPADAVLTGDTRVLRDAASAANWLRRANRSDVQLLVQASSNPAWHDSTGDGRHGVSFALVGYRIWDRCDGYVLAVSDRLKDNAVGPIDKSKCK